MKSKRIWYILMAVFLLAPTSTTASDFHCNQTIHSMNDNLVPVCTLSHPAGSVTNCSAVPPLICKQVDHTWGIFLDPAGLPVYTEYYHHVSFDVDGERHSVLINVSCYHVPTAPDISINATAIEGRLEGGPEMDDDVLGSVVAFLIIGIVLLMVVNRI